MQPDSRLKIKSAKKSVPLVISYSFFDQKNSSINLYPVQLKLDNVKQLNRIKLEPYKILFFSKGSKYSRVS